MLKAIRRFILGMHEEREARMQAQIDLLVKENAAVWQRLFEYEDLLAMYAPKGETHFTTGVHSHEEGSIIPCVTIHPGGARYFDGITAKPLVRE